MGSHGGGCLRRKFRVLLWHDALVPIEEDFLHQEARDSPTTRVMLDTLSTEFAAFGRQ